jgi:CheY-like chemotaxis protein
MPANPTPPQELHDRLSGSPHPGIWFVDTLFAELHIWIVMTQTPTSTTGFEEAAPPMARPSVLLVENDTSTIDAMTQLLTHYECDVKSARTLLEAMPLLPATPQFAILDLMLPDGGGDRVLELIRRRKMPTKVVVITACRDRDRLRDVARLKPDLILTKPLNFIRLLDFIRAGT